MIEREGARMERGMTWVRGVFPVLMVLGLLALALSGVFRVESDEVAMILRFGKLVGDNPQQALLGPGLHFAFPYVIDEVVKVPVGKVRQLTVSTHYDVGSAINTDINKNGYVLTGDQNLILVQAVVKHRIDDPVVYALHRSSVEREIDGIVSGELNAWISRMGVDALLTTGKAQLAEDVKRSAQAELSRLNCGVTITNIELVNLSPPREVQGDFDAVNASSVEKETTIQRANEYREIAVPEAQATAQRQIGSAKTAQSKVVAKAQASAAEFESLLEQYKLSPDVVLDGVLRQRINDVLAKLQLVVVPEVGTPSRMTLP